MSVIGPRPQLVRDMTFMTKEQRMRHTAKPGLVRVMVEAESEEICQKYVDMVVNVIKENGYVAG